MHYYRYRPCSETSFKELLYNEIYFSSPEECNDPFDSKTFYEFPADKARWTRLIEQAMPFKSSVDGRSFYVDIANFLHLKCPLSLGDVLKFTLSDSPHLSKKYSKDLLILTEERVKSLINRYLPDTRYFVSFSRGNNIPTMWSLYADKHQGFCLIFKSVNNTISQCRRKKKHQIVRNTPNNFAERVSYEMPETFEFRDIEYKAHVQPINAFKCLSSFIYGELDNEDAIAELRAEQGSHYIQKDAHWDREQESRLILPPPPSFIMGGHYGYSIQERLFHYEPTHLVGLIFGARMSETHRQRIIEILNERHDWINREYNEGPHFRFFLFDAKLASNERSIIISPSEMLNGQNNIPGTENFERLLKEWKDGWGWERYKNQTGSGSRKTHYP